ncbi:MAG: 50S ribosomal protein L30 [Myxococcota bacterium]
MARYFEVELKRGLAGHMESHKRTLKGMGLTRFGKKVYLPDTEPVRGMLYKVNHMVTVTPHEGERPASARMRAKAAGGYKKPGSYAKQEA